MQKKSFSAVAALLVSLVLLPSTVWSAENSNPDAIVHISPDTNASNASVWALTRAGQLKWCRSAATSIECITHTPSKKRFFVKLAERAGSGGSSVWALSRSGNLYWCRPEGMESIACYR